MDSESCDNRHWCAALTIDSLTALRLTQPNPACAEPVNFAFIQRNGVPTGAPRHRRHVASFTQNGQTLLMNPGDNVSVHMSDAPVPGGGERLQGGRHRLDPHTSGFMQASAENGFMNTTSTDCSGTPYNFQPEYNTVPRGNIIPWAALQTNISTEFETGHFEPCTSLSQPITQPVRPVGHGRDLQRVLRAVRNRRAADNGTAETGDAICYYAGDTHPGYNGPGSSTPPNTLTGCQDNIFQNGDLDFDGTPYWPEWPTGQDPTRYRPVSSNSPPTATAGSTRSTSSRPTSR